MTASARETSAREGIDAAAKCRWRTDTAREKAPWRARAGAGTRARAMARVGMRRLLALALAALVVACGWSGWAIEARWATGGTMRSPSWAAVLTSPWARERVANAERICEIVVESVSVGCALANGTRIDEDAAAMVEARGYIAAFEPYDVADHSDKTWTPSRVLRLLRRPFKFYAHRTADKRKTRLYESTADRATRAASIGNLALYGIMATFVSEPPHWASDPPTRSPPLVDIWPDVKTALAKAAEIDRLYPEARRESILLFEDDANVVSPTARAFRDEIDSLMRALPRDWDILSLDPHPRFCEESTLRHPSHRTSLRRRVYRTYTTFSRTTALVVSRRGATKILARLPTNIVVDMFLARMLRQGQLTVYVACDASAVRQRESALPSLGG